MTRSDSGTTTDGGLVFPHIPPPSTSTSRRVQQRQRFPSRLTVDLANQTLTALNQVSSILDSDDIHSANARQPHQLQPSTIHRCHSRVYHACARFRRHSSGDGSSPIDDSSIYNHLDLINSNGGPSGLTMSSAPSRRIIADVVSLPSVAGTAELLNVLPPHLSSVYSDPTRLLQPPSTRSPTRPLVRRAAFMCDRNEYIKLIRRMMDRGMISFTQSPMVVNGLFGVDKDGGASIRLIVDARPVNSMFIPSPAVNLPTPDLVASFNVPRGTTLHAAKVDLDNFYHRIRLPPQWWPYFALPAIDSSSLCLQSFPAGTLVYPCCTTLPMGFSHSVFLAQSVHEHIIDTRVPLLRRCDRIVRHSVDTQQVDPGGTPPVPVLQLATSLLPSPSTDLNIDRLRHSVYIDDLNLYGTDPATMNAAMDQYLAAMEVTHLPAKPSKVVRPSSDGVECLGVVVDGGAGEVGMAVPKLQVLRGSTLRLLEVSECTGRELSHIVGRWNWAMLVRRPAMAVFSAVYRFIEVAKDLRFTLWPSVRRELWAVSRLAPLLFANFRCEWAEMVVVTDASELGSGVVYSDKIESVTAQSLASQPCRPGEPLPAAVDSFIRSTKWRVAVSHAWRDEEHINALEVRSVLTSVRWMMTRPAVLADGADHRRVLVLCDSSATVGSINKGRSSSHRLLRPLRSITSLVLAAGLYLTVRWIPTLMNPADGPSRLNRVIHL